MGQPLAVFLLTYVDFLDDFCYTPVFDSLTKMKSL